MAKRKDNNESANDQNENSAEDNFGLPDIEYKPLETQPETEESQQEPVVTVDEERAHESYNYEAEEETSSNAPIIIAIVIGLVLIVGGYLVYQYVYKPKAEKEKRELAAKLDAEKKQREEEARIARGKEEAERKRQEEAAASAATVKPAVGTIESLSARTGRYYVVIASAVDGDLVMDHAKKLSAKGVSIKIVPPFGKWKFYRLTIGDYDSFDAAQAGADSAKAEFGEGVWVIKY